MSSSTTPPAESWDSAELDRAATFLALARHRAKAAQAKAPLQVLSQKAASLATQPLRHLQAPGMAKQADGVWDQIQSLGRGVGDFAQKQWADPSRKSMILSGLLGAGALGATGLATNLSSGARRKKPLTSALTGALLGGVLGAGGYGLYDYMGGNKKIFDVQKLLSGQAAPGSASGPVQQPTISGEAKLRTAQELTDSKHPTRFKYVRNLVAERKANPATADATPDFSHITNEEERYNAEANHLGINLPDKVDPQTGKPLPSPVATFARDAYNTFVPNWAKNTAIGGLLGGTATLGVDAAGSALNRSQVNSRTATEAYARESPKILEGMPGHDYDNKTHSMSRILDASEAQREALIHNTKMVHPSGHVDVAIPAEGSHPAIGALHGPGGVPLSPEAGRAMINEMVAGRGTVSGKINTARPGFAGMNRTLLGQQHPELTGRRGAYTAGTLGGAALGAATSLGPWLWNNRNNDLTSEQLQNLRHMKVQVPGQ